MQRMSPSVPAKPSDLDIEMMITNAQKASEFLKALSHEARLHAKNMVETRRDGKNIYYLIARSKVKDDISALHAAFCRPKRSK